MQSLQKNTRERQFVLPACRFGARTAIMDESALMRGIFLCDLLAL